MNNFSTGVVLVVATFGVVLTRADAGDDTAALPPNGAVGYWSFDDRDVSGPKVRDKSGREHDAVVLKGTLVTGRVGQAIELDGKESGVTIKGAVAAGHQRSTLLWLRKRGKGVRRLIHIDAYNQIGFSGEAIFVHTGRVTRSDFNLPLAPVPFAKDRWTHLAVTWDTKRDSDNVRVYVNGELHIKATLDASLGRPLRAGTLRLGHDGSLNSDEQAFVGVFDELAIYDTALTAEQIREYVRRVAMSSGERSPKATKRRIMSQGGDKPRTPYVPKDIYCGRKKLIRVGSELCSHLLDSPSIAAIDLPVRVKAWQDTGLDGIVFSIASHDREKLRAHWNMTGQWWNLTRRDYAEFKPEIAAFRSVKDWGRLTDNFLWSSMAVWQEGFTSRCQDWYSNEDWNILLANVRLQARVARECGFKGILLDTEQYVGHHARGAWHLPFNYAVYADEGFELAGEERPRSFDEVAEQVRRRGKQYARTICDAFPGIRLFLIPGLYELVEQDVELREAEYGLYPAFVDGLLTGLDKQATVISGNEMTYNKTRYRDIARVRQLYDESIARTCGVSAELRSRMSFAAGIWADAGGTWSNVDASLNPRTPNEHKLALQNAFRSSGEYAWLYGEKSFFLRTPTNKILREYFRANIAAHK